MKAVILTSQRSGSGFLSTCLNAHPGIRCYGEILIGHGLGANQLYKGGRVPPVLSRSEFAAKWWKYLIAGAWRPTRLLDEFYARSEAPVMMFVAMYNHLRDPRTRRYLCSHTDIRVVHLRRDNLLKQYVSKVLLDQKRNRPSHSTEPVSIASVKIVPQRAVEGMRKMRELYERYNRLFACHPKIELVYETMIEAGGLSLVVQSAVTELLEIDVALTMQAPLVKTNPNRLELIVENYNELARALRGTEFERFLD